jgi:hypothetical protein
MVTMMRTEAIPASWMSALRSAPSRSLRCWWSHVVEPRHGAPDDPPSSPHGTVMLCVPPRRARLDAPFLAYLLMKFGVVRTVARNSIPPAWRSSRLATHGRDRVHRRDHPGNVMLKGPFQRDCERNAVRCDRRIVPGSFPPALCVVLSLFFRNLTLGSRTTHNDSTPIDRVGTPQPSRQGLVCFLLHALVYPRFEAPARRHAGPPATCLRQAPCGIPVRRTKTIAESASRLPIGLGAGCRNRH